MIIYRQEDMEKSFRVNFHGPLNITRAVLPRLRAKGKGTLLYVSSQAAWHADPSASGYCSSKFALEGKPTSKYEHGSMTDPLKALLNV
jgi:short-subunit dehydrogenase